MKTLLAVQSDTPPHTHTSIRHLRFAPSGLIWPHIAPPQSQITAHSLLLRCYDGQGVRRAPTYHNICAAAGKLVVIIEVISYY